MLSQQDQEMRRNVPDPSFADGSHLCGSGAGTETSCTRDFYGDWEENGGCDLPAEDAANSQTQAQRRIARRVER